MGASPDSVALNGRRPLSASVAARPARGLRPLALWHLLSLDAPTVATTWTWFVARCFGFSLSAFELTGMFLAVWMLYAADRLLDSMASSSLANQDATDDQGASKLQPRHHFHARHRRFFGVSLALASIGLAVCVVRFPHTELALYLILGALLALWFAAIHGVARRYSLRLPKEMAVGLFFAGAVFNPTLTRQFDLFASMLIPAIFLGVLCALNGLFIHRWEHVPSKPARTKRNDIDWSTIDWSTRWLLSRLPQVALLCCLVPLLLFIFEQRNQRLIEFAVSLSAIALLLLDRLRQNFEQTTLRALADFVLLSPLLLVPLLR